MTSYAAGRGNPPRPMPLIRFRHHFHGLLAACLNNVVGFFQFAEFGNGESAFWCTDGAAGNGLHQHLVVAGVYQTGCDGEAFNPEFSSLKSTD